MIYKIEKKSNFERKDALASSYTQKRSKGKPQIIYRAYYDICKKMILQNIENIKKVKCTIERKRLRNLNNSILQRLKKRREQELDTVKRQQRKERVDWLCTILDDFIEPHQKKRLAKVLSKQS